MFKLEDLYKKMVSPLDNPDAIQRIIDAYSSNPSVSVDAFFSKIYMTSGKKETEVQVKDREDFILEVTNEWKKTVDALSDEQIASGIRRKIYSAEFPNKQRLLKQLPPFASYAEISETLDRKLNMINDSWLKYNIRNSWTNVDIGAISSYTKTTPKIDHRLYINPEQKDIYKVIKLFRDECIKRGLPYLFKFADKELRDDAIVIYSDTASLTQYIEVLMLIKRNNPKIVRSCFSPPCLTGTIDNWIGYGAEPKEILRSDGYKKTQSYTSVRSEVIEDSIKKVMANWITENRDLKFKINNQKMSVGEYVSLKVADRFIEMHRKRFERSRNESTVASNYLEKEGFEKDELTSPEFRGRVGSAVFKGLTDYYDCIKTFKRDYKIPKVSTRGGKIQEITPGVISSGIEKSVSTLVKLDPSLLKTIRLEILSRCKDANIDTTNFCFNSDTRAKISEFVEVNEIEEKRPQKTLINMTRFRK